MTGKGNACKSNGERMIEGAGKGKGAVWMIRAAGIGLIMLLLAACGNMTEPTVASDEQQWLKAVLKNYPELNEATMHMEQVGRVIDGDTFDTATSDHRVRLIGVNTPEIRPVEHYGKEASAFAKSKLEGKRVMLFADAGNKDRYGRLLRYVFVDGQDLMFNELLLQEGYANTMTIAPNVTYADRFVMVEREAREQERGLWKETDKATSSGGDDGAEAGGNTVGKTGEPNNNAAPQSNSCKEPTIKGNINSKGDKIYHMPGGASYEQTKAEEMFCTEDEAIDAGFRAAKR